MKKFFKIGSKKGSGADASSQGAPADGRGYNIKEKDLAKLHKAAWNGDLNKVKQLAKKDPSALDKENRTPLHLACVRGHHMVVQELLEWKAKLHLGDNDARTPLMKAVQCGQEECARLCLESKADPNTKDKQGDTCLHYASRDGNNAMMELLLAVDKADIDIQNKEGQTPLHFSVLHKSMEAIHLLLNEGANCDVQNGEGRTPVMVASQEGYAEAVGLLLENSADVNIKDNRGWTADDIAIMGSQDACREAIAEHVAMTSSGVSQGSKGSMRVTGAGGGAVGGGMYGGPALDEMDDEPSASETGSKLSEAAAGNESWNDTDEEMSEMELRKKNQVPKLNLAKILKKDDDDTSDAVPALKKVENKDAGPGGAVSARSASATARSTASAHSQLSFGGDDKGWSDDESALFSEHDNNNGKVSLVKLQQQRGAPNRVDSIPDGNESWSDNESAPQSGGRQLTKERKLSNVEDENTTLPVEEKMGTKTVPNGRQEVVGSTSDFDSEEEEPSVGDAIKNMPKEKQRQILAELGLSDVSEVSDPSLSDGEGEGRRSKVKKGSRKQTPPQSARSDAASDWDSTVPSATPRTPKGRMPLSARDSNNTKATNQATKQNGDAKANSQMLGHDDDEESEWDSTVADDVIDAAVNNLHSQTTTPRNNNHQVRVTAASLAAEKTVNLQSAKSTPRSQADDDSKWDSDTEDVSSPRKSGRGMYGEDDSEEETESEWEKDKRVQKEAEEKKKQEEKEREEALQKQKQEEEEKQKREQEERRQEEERQREIERQKEEERQQEEARLREIERQREEEQQKEDARQREIERQKKWEEEFERQQEKLRKEAAEELKREEEQQRKLQEEKGREEKERQQKLERELKEQKEKEERELKERHEKEERDRLEKERREREEREQREKEEQERREKAEQEKKKQEEDARQKREEQERKEKEEMEQRLRLEESQVKVEQWRVDTQVKLRDANKEEEDVRSKELRQQREKAERDLEEERNRQQRLRQQSHGDDDFDDEDTFNDIEDMDIMVRQHASVVNKGKTMTMSPMDDDGLSYSSTEHDLSGHEALPHRDTFGSPAPLSLSMNNADPTAVMRLQEQMRETKRQLDRERSTRSSVESKRKSAERDKADLIQKLEDVTHTKAALESGKIDMESKIRTLKYKLGEEEEKRKNVETLYGKTKEQLARKEEMYTAEVDAKQKADLTVRNLQMELRTSMSNVKQLEDDKEELSRLLSHEKSARQLQEQLNEDQVRLQRTLEDTNSASVQAEVISRLESSDENRKQAIESVDKLKAELYALKMELERQRVRYKDDHTMMSEENEELLGKIDELKSDLKLNEEALAHATMQYNLQLNSLTSDNTKLSTVCDREKSAKEKLETEMESLKGRLQSSATELEKSQQARSELERNNHKEHGEWTKLLERKDSELAHLKESKENMVQRLTLAESKASSIENELQIANATLTERTSQLSTIQRELDQRRAAQENLDGSVQREKEENVRLQGKMEALQERLNAMQQENQSLQTKAARGDGPDISTVITSLKADHDKDRNSLENKNAHLNDNVTRLKEELRSVDTRRSTLEQDLHHLRQDLSESHKKLSIAEAQAEIASRTKEQLESERNSLKGEIERLKAKLDSSKEKQIEAQSKVAQLVERVEKSEQNTAMTSQQLAVQSASVQEASKNKNELSDTVHKMELEKARLESALQHEKQRVEMLQRELNESSQARRTMEGIVSNLNDSKSNIEGRLNEATVAKTLAAQDAEDSRDLWESEIKSKSKLGLRIAQLERAKQDAVSQLDEEKRKTRKALEMKKIAEAKMGGDTDRVTQLQKEVTSLRVHLKAARKRLKELDVSDHHVNVLNSEFDRERQEYQHTLNTIRRQMDGVHSSLQEEMVEKESFASKTRELEQELISLRNLEKNYSKMERMKRILEEELASVKGKLSSSEREQTDVERLKAELEARSRMELNTKLEEVNAYLETQARARERLDHMRDANESELRRDFEKNKRELLDELSRLRSSYSETLSQKESHELQARKLQDLYESEVRMREKLADRLQRANEMASTKVFTMHDSSRGNGLSSLNNGSPILLGKASPNHGMNDAFSHKMKAQLDRSIAKHMEKGPHIDVSLPPRSLDDSSLFSRSFDKSSSEYMTVLKKNYLL